MAGINSGKGSKVAILAVLNLYVIWIITSIPGLAITPIMPTLLAKFHCSELETQMLTVAPNIAAIPFVFLGGALATKFNNMKLLNWVCLFYGIAGALFFIAPNMITIIILSFIIGIFAGVVSPLSGVFVADMFSGKECTKQFGYTSAVLNLFLMLSVIATGYLAKISWRLPFVVYLIPFLPLLYAKQFSKYIAEPVKKDSQGNKVHWKFSEQCNVGALTRYSIFYLVISIVCGAISNFVPYLVKSSTTAGYLTSMMFFGIMASGFTLNWCLKIIKKGVALWILLLMGVGYVLIFISHSPIIIGLGIFIACFFYGIGQPYYYSKCTAISTGVTVSLAMATYTSMDSLANVVDPFFYKYAGMIFGWTPKPMVDGLVTIHQESPFILSAALMGISAVAVIIYYIYGAARKASGKPIVEMPPIEVEAYKQGGAAEEQIAARYGTLVVPPSAMKSAHAAMIQQISPLDRAFKTLQSEEEDLQDVLKTIQTRVAADEARIKDVENDIAKAQADQAAQKAKDIAATTKAAADAKAASEAADAAAAAAGAVPAKPAAPAPDASAQAPAPDAPKSDNSAKSK